MRFAIVEDQKIDREKLLHSLHMYCKKNNLQLTTPIALYENGESLIASYIPSALDVIFLDIYMNGMTGMEVAQRIRLIDPYVSLIFTTSSIDFAVASYEVNASYYLVKPYDYIKLEQSLQSIHSKLIKDTAHIALDSYPPIVLKEIIYTEYKNRYIHIFKTNGDTCLLRMTQSKWESYLLPHSAFQTCCKGVIVNFEHVLYIENYDFHMKTHILVPISRRKLSEMKKCYHTYLFESIRH